MSGVATTSLTAPTHSATLAGVGVALGLALGEGAIASSPSASGSCRLGLAALAPAVGNCKEGEPDDTAEADGLALALGDGSTLGLDVTSPERSSTDTDGCGDDADDGKDESTDGDADGDGDDATISPGTQRGGTALGIDHSAATCSTASAADAGGAVVKNADATTAHDTATRSADRTGRRSGTPPTERTSNIHTPTIRTFPTGSLGDDTVSASRIDIGGDTLEGMWEKPDYSSDGNPAPAVRQAEPGVRTAGLREPSQSIEPGLTTHS